MVKAYVLIQSEPGKEGQVVEAVLQVRGVISAERVTGPYDVITLAEARNLDELGRRVISSVRALEGVIRALPRNSGPAVAGAGFVRVGFSVMPEFGKKIRALGSGNRPCGAPRSLVGIDALVIQGGVSCRPPT